MSDLAVIIPSITTLAAGLGGYWLAGKNEESRDERAATREAQARLEEQQDRIASRRNTIQLETLLELQDEMQRFLRATSDVMFQDRKTLRTNGTMTLLPEGMSEEDRAALISVRRLRVRLLNEPLRLDIEQFVVQCVQIGLKHVDLYKQQVPPVRLIQVIDEDGARISSAYETLTDSLGVQIRAEIVRGLSQSA
jgi:hypothetical protein